MEALGKRVMVTGAAGCIGRYITKNLAAVGAEVIIVCRTEEECMEVVQFVQHRIGDHAHLTHYAVDLSLHSNIRALVDSYTKTGKPLHALICNHGTAPKTRQETPEGLETQFATNVMGYFWLAKYFAPLMSSTAEACGEHSRVVFVSSYWAGGMKPEDIEFKNRPYDNNEAYRQSKQAQRLLALTFSQKFAEAGKNIYIYSCHPGDVNSKLANSLGYSGRETGDEGAATPVWLALDKSIASPAYSGKYYKYKKDDKCGYCKDKKSLHQIWDICEATTERLSKT